MELIVTRITTRTEGKNKIEESIDYDLVTKTAYVYGRDDEDPHTESTDIFKKDLKRVVKLAIKESDYYQGKVNNNKIVIGMSDGRELEKATKHLAQNKEKLDFINAFIIKSSK